MYSYVPFPCSVFICTFKPKNSYFLCAMLLLPQLMHQPVPPWSEYFRHLNWGPYNIFCMFNHLWGAVNATLTTSEVSVFICTLCWTGRGLGTTPQLSGDFTGLQKKGGKFCHTYFLLTNHQVQNKNGGLSEVLAEVSAKWGEHYMPT